MTYEIPVDGYEGRVQLQTLARRIARAVVHFLQVSTRFERGFSAPKELPRLYSCCTSLQANMIPISWDRVILYHLEETAIGVWQPVLSTS